MIVSEREERKPVGSDPAPKYQAAYEALNVLTPKERTILRDSARFVRTNPNWQANVKEALGRSTPVTWSEISGISDRISSAFELIDKANQLGPFTVNVWEANRTSISNSLCFSTVNAGQAAWMTGDRKSGVARLGIARKMASRIYTSPDLLDLLRGCALRQVLDSACGRIIFTATDESSLDRMDAFLKTDEVVPDLRVAIRSEAKSGLYTIAELRKDPAHGGLGGLDWKDRDFWRYQTLRAPIISVSVSAKLLETLTKHYRRLPVDPENLIAARDVIRDLNREVHADRSFIGGLADDAGFDYEQVQLTSGGVLVRKRLLRAMIEVQKVKLRSGAYPAALPESAVGILDPYSGSPLRYRRSGMEYVLYSVGTNGVDDGGVRGGTGAYGKKDATLEFYLGQPMFRN